MQGNARLSMMFSFLQVRLVDRLGNTLDRLDGVPVICSVGGQVDTAKVSKLVQTTGALNIEGQNSAVSVRGVVAFTGLYLTKPGTFWLNFQSRSFSMTSTTFQVVHNQLDRFEFIVQPENAAHGVTWKVQPSVQLVDKFSNLILVGYAVKARLYKYRIAGDRKDAEISSALACSECTGDPVENVLSVTTGIIQFTDLAVKIDDNINPQIVIEDGLGLEIAAYNTSLCEHMGSYVICNPATTEIVHGKSISTKSNPFNVFRVSSLQILTQPGNSMASR
jgi:hypothetical protein